MQPAALVSAEVQCEWQMLRHQGLLTTEVACRCTSVTQLRCQRHTSPSHAWCKAFTAVTVVKDTWQTVLQLPAVPTPVTQPVGTNIPSHKHEIKSGLGTRPCGRPSTTGYDFSSATMRLTPGNRDPKTHSNTIGPLGQGSSCRRYGWWLVALQHIVCYCCRLKHGSSNLRIA